MTAKTEAPKAEKFSLGHTVMLAVEATREALRRVFTKEVVWEETDIVAEPVKHDREADGRQTEYLDRQNSFRTVRIKANLRAPLAETARLDYSFEAVCELHVFVGQTWEPRRVTIVVSGKTYNFDFDTDFSDWWSEEMGNPAFHIREFDNNPDPIYL